MDCLSSTARPGIRAAGGDQKFDYRSGEGALMGRGRFIEIGHETMALVTRKDAIALHASGSSAARET